MNPPFFPHFCAHNVLYIYLLKEIYTDSDIQSSEISNAHNFFGPSLPETMNKSLVDDAIIIIVSYSEYFALQGFL